MGVVATYYLVENEIIEKVKNEDFDLCSYFYENELMEHTHNGVEFEKCGLIFGTGVKSWHPMFELLKLMDESNEKIFRLTCAKENEIEETSANSRLNYIYAENAKKMWDEIKKISIAEIEFQTKNKRTIDLISSIEGYWTERIASTEMIILEFIELFQALLYAVRKNRGIIIEFG